MGNRKKFLRILIICSVIIMLTGCSQLFGKDKAKTDETLAVSANAPFGVKLMDGWKITEQGALNSNSDLEAMNEDETLYFLAMMEKKADLSVDLKGYNDIVVGMNENNYGVSLSKSKATKIGKYNAYVNEFDLASDNLNTHMWLFSVETDNYYGQLFAWTLASQADTYKDELMNIVNSFRETKE